MPDLVWSIYGLVDPFTGQVRYVGKSIDVAARLKAHLRDPDNTHKARWIRSLISRGSSPEVIVPETGVADWAVAEVKWISRLQSLACALTNSTAGGEGLHDPHQETRALLSCIQRSIWDDPVQRAARSEMYQTIEWRSAVSIAARGAKKSTSYVAALPQNSPGYPWSTDERARRRADLLAHAAPVAHSMPRSPAQLAHVKRLSEVNKGKSGWALGRVLADEERLARSTSQKGRPKSPEHREKIRQAAIRRWARARKETEEPT